MSNPAIFMVLRLKEDGLVIINIDRLKAYSNSEFGYCAELKYGNCSYIVRETVPDIAALVHASESGLSHMMKEGHKNHIGYYEGEIHWLTPDMIRKLHDDSGPRETKIQSIK